MTEYPAVFLAYGIIFGEKYIFTFHYLCISYVVLRNKQMLPVPNLYSIPV